jgi:hypothetical protein
MNDLIRVSCCIEVGFCACLLVSIKEYIIITVIVTGMKGVAWQGRCGVVEDDVIEIIDSVKEVRFRGERAGLTKERGSI